MQVVPDADRLAHRWVNRLLRNEMISRGVTYPDLERRLTAIGVNESESALRSRVSRGDFSAALLLQCLTVIGSKRVGIELDGYVPDARMEEEVGTPDRRTRNGPNHAAPAGGAMVVVMITFSGEKYFFSAASKFSRRHFYRHPRLPPVRHRRCKYGA